jgi:large subunit ribosomal protein L20
MMTRARSCSVKKQRHKKVLKLCKGYFGRAKSCFSIAKRLLIRSYNFQFYSRKKKKSEKRREFISIINAFCRDRGTKYSIFINKFNKHKISKVVDRKSFALTIQNNLQGAKNIFSIVTE